MSANPHRPNHADWKRISAFAVSGALLTASGAFVGWSYLQGVIINLGTTLFLFGYLWVAEQRLVTRIDMLSKPGTLAEAQLRARDVLRAASTSSPSIESYTELVATCLAATGAKIMQAGFVQRRPASEQAPLELYHRQTATTWKLEHAGENLRHCISFGDGAVLATDWVHVGPQLTAEELRVALQQFEHQVFHGLLVVIGRLNPERRSPALRWRRR
ncbi:hypothetical protein ONA70_30905 [Micromonospora yasonensis]|uniref:hypothetical protein n=1 Tax=Micromonospora yasonensis TaxID=1128667 RepID=UPI00222FF561|nr:hypothetical protein [Micromonospora yasonensis]MCW3844504.1 hypothetical protein [Micromonospora yasonensis]